MIRKKNIWFFHISLFINFILTINYVYPFDRKIKTKERVIFKYKKNEKIDLGDLSVAGKEIFPGDLTVRERKRYKPKENIFEKKDFEKEIEDDFNFFTRSML